MPKQPTSLTPSSNAAQTTQSTLQNNPLLLSHLLNLNSQANKQSVLDTANLDARTLSALAQNHETSSMGNVDNVSSAVNSLAFVGDGSDAS